MHAVSEDKILKWSKFGNHNAPGQVSVHCSACGNRSAYQIRDWIWEESTSTLSSKGSCGVCNHHERFWLLDPTDRSQSSPLMGTGLFSTALPGPERGALPPTGIPDRLYSAYMSALESYNAGVWTGTAVCCRRALEGIVKDKLPEEECKKPLAAALATIGDHTDLAKPIKDLSHAIRQGGNLGAHFDFEKEPDPEMGQMMLELLESLLTYLYELPGKITELDAKIADTNS